MSDMLEDQGFSVRSFSSPAEVLRDPNLEDAAVIVVDFMMPEMNGAEPAPAIRKRIPDQRIVFVSGYPGVAALDSLAGPNSKVLRKPFSTADLAEVLAQLDISKQQIR